MFEEISMANMQAIDGGKSIIPLIELEPILLDKGPVYTLPVIKPVLVTM